MKPHLLLAAIALLAAAPALADPAPTAPSATANMQGNDTVWRTSPYIHQFYDAVVVACADGPDKADIPALEAKSKVIFEAFGASMHWKPGVMSKHLEAIPRQIVGIAKDDPKVLQSYDAFVIALMGPE